VWVAGVNLTGPSEERGADLLRIDPITNSISAVLPVSAFSVQAGADAVWVTSPADGVNDFLHNPEAWVAREIDPTPNEILAPIPLPGNVSGVLAVTDGILSLFGDPIPFEDHAERAVATAFEMQHHLHAIRGSWLLERGEDLNVGIGISTGYVTVGNIGSATRTEYTVIGNHINLASRLATNAEAQQILVSERTLAAVRDHVDATPVDEISLKGVNRPIRIFAIVNATADRPES
jgi:Adenylate and Guanylate cyclase catalytic domain